MKKIAACVLMLILATLGWVLYANDYQFTTERIALEASGNRLTGTLVLPKLVSGKLGVIVFIHGDGPANASLDEGYYSVWETMAKQGYAVLAFDKAGVGGSSGNWLHQTMNDRTKEAVDIIDWARKDERFNSQCVGLWGASQAGWVMPEIAGQRPDIAFTLAVAPAINWLRQGRYNTRAEMAATAMTKRQIQTQEAQDRHLLSLLGQPNGYVQYRREYGPLPPLSADRWRFIRGNMASDATKGLRNFKTPVHLIVGGRDLNVDVDETERVYRQNIPANLLTVTRIERADHMMLKPLFVRHPVLINVIGLFAPRSVQDEAYLQDVAAFLGDQPCSRGR
ncbi:alpha/beta hydrolase family protein [Serratia entomophila]|uniref:alpha/beta hydrolase family protein n=1 Tax=Serratia entomophila TaxID=42906 RepID=UPI0021773E70|nr:alpha/beta fold hydrolase [Serratia entomophila]CAI0895823.1 exosortase A system-associated hydrolase 1 [Serratia entomophila]CAI0900631.1 exosortase A system-associated hydrolase 1 [Serratia entomophila]CAI1582701.1 exosortase A system-associated hydrolase 1 [Serratia entomophila]CAI1719777.1 exosortase A system-associated hydrolase 1 [Serratia entomophila]CAI1733401.1 exosortase A system-associated hydrolase 1 [Serratia entomophila]